MHCFLGKTHRKLLKNGVSRILGYRAVLTTDLLLSIKEDDGLRHLAISVKLTKDQTPRVKEKLFLEKYYWRLRGVPMIVLSEKTIPEIRTWNLSFFEGSIRSNDVVRSKIDPIEFAKHFEKNWEPNHTYNEILKATCPQFKVGTSLGHNILGSAVWSRNTKIDIDVAKMSHVEQVVLKA